VRPRCIQEVKQTAGIKHITSENTKQSEIYHNNKNGQKWVAGAVVSPGGLPDGVGCARILAGSRSGCGDGS